MTYLIVLAVLLGVVVVISGPIRRHAGSPPAAPEMLELEAARDAKYREIRDAELDHQTGKLSDADFEAIDSSLRAEAIKILRALDRAAGSEQRSD